MNELISIIVPVYNVEKYLDKCIISIINQTYKNLEIILVDDGSKDKSGKKCDEWAAKDHRIRVIHKKNGGLSDARNIGIDNCKGKYISFIDSDDFIATEYIEILYKNIKEMKCDISICNPYYYYEDKINKIVERYKIKEDKIVDNSLNMTIDLMYQKHFDTSAWGKLYETRLFKQNKIYYPKGKLYEDIVTTYKVFMKSKKIIFINKNLYYYRQRSNSIMSSKFNPREMDYVTNSEIMMNDLSKINLEIKKAAISRFLSTNFAIYRKIPNDQEFYKEVKFIKGNIKKYRRIVLFDKNSRLKNKFAILISYINLKILKFYK
ncbi:glycosyltransferase [Clostridium baratii]|uniref:glycosyltransferase family 2 protein n=1 Tax=Clostridium baratii TaxID=1561 RepID=UPI0030D250EE